MPGCVLKEAVFVSVGVTLFAHRQVFERLGYRRATTASGCTARGWCRRAMGEPPSVTFTFTRLTPNAPELTGARIFSPAQFIQFFSG